MTKSAAEFMREQIDGWAHDMAAALTEKAVVTDSLPGNVILLANLEQVTYRLRQMGFVPGVDRIPEQAIRTAMEGAVFAVVNVRGEE